MLTVRVLYFAGIRETLGRSEDEITLPDDVQTIRDLARHLETRSPELAGRLASVRFAVNEEFAKADRSIGRGDVVAIIPPVSGG